MTTPITQFSRIQHRRGPLIDMPDPGNPLNPGTLNTSEFGHVIDQQRLFLGNGTLLEGAPIVGNTEVITDFTLLNNSTALKRIYRSNVTDAGNPFEPQTGPTVNSPIVRGIGQVLDDRVCVKDFGAAGDGVTDDTVAINRALEEIFTKVPGTSAAEQAYRSLYFPAGVYRVTNYIFIPTYAEVFGDGPRKTVIKMDAVVSPIVRLADSKFQSGALIGTTGGIPPQHIHVYNMSFSRADDGDIVHLELLSDSPTNIDRDIYFENCRFSGAWITGDTATAAVYIENLGANLIDNIKFVNCQTANTAYAIYSDFASTNISRVFLDNCDLVGHYRGINLDPSASFSDVKVINSYFTTLEAEAFRVTAPHSHIISSNNTYRQCAADSTLITPISIVDFMTGAEFCSSVDDKFINNTAPGVVNVTDNATSSVILNNTGDMVFQNITMTPLLPSYALDSYTITPTATATGYEFDITKFNTAYIDYTIKCFNDIRVGRLFIASNGTVSGTVLGDQYTETNPIGITFTANLIIGDKIELFYQPSSVVTDTSNAQPSTLNIQSKLWLSDFA